MRVVWIILSIFVLVTLTTGAPRINLARTFGDAAAAIALDDTGLDASLDVPVITLDGVVRTLCTLEPAAPRIAEPPPLSISSCAPKNLASGANLIAFRSLPPLLRGLS